MRTKKYIAILVVLFSGVLVGCQSDAVSTDFGTFIHYDNFAWCKYTPDTLHKNLVVTENDSQQPVKLGLYKLDDDSGRYLPTSSEVQLYANSELCKNNVLTICPGDTEIDLGIVFAPDAERKAHKWIFKVLDMGGLECINNTESHVGTELTTMTMGATMDHIWNPLAKGLVLVLGAILGLLVVWFLVIRLLLYDYFGVAKVNLETPERLYSKKVKGLLSITFTAKKQTQSGFERLFVGERLYVVDEFFEAGDIVVEPKNKKSVRIKGVQNYDATSTTVCVNDEPVVIKNPAKQKCEITVI